MDVYIDKANIISFLHQYNDKRFQTCSQMLKEQCKLCLNFSKEDILSDQKYGRELLAWLKTLSSGMSSKITWRVGFPTRPLKTNCYNSFSPNQLSSVYLLDDEKIETLLGKGVLLLSKPGKEVDVLANLLFENKQYQKNIFRKMTSWKVLEDYISPCTDIVIVDQYVCSDESLLESNLYVLLESLCSYAHISKINIVIFTLKETYNRTTNHICMPDWKKILDKISDKIEAKTEVAPNITIIAASKDNLQEHDRTIFTNYKSFFSGDTINYFDSVGNKITKGRTFYVNSLVERDNYNDALDFLTKMQEVYDRIKKLNPDLIHKKGELKCNFIKL